MNGRTPGLAGAWHPRRHLAPRALALDRPGREEFPGLELQIDSELCQGHGRCYDLAPDLFREDAEGYGQVLADGVMPPDKADDARRAALNCPERAIRLTGTA